jgi:hypothetical protein
MASIIVNYRPHPLTPSPIRRGGNIREGLRPSTNTPLRVSLRGGEASLPFPPLPLGRGHRGWVLKVKNLFWTRVINYIEAGSLLIHNS